MVAMKLTGAEGSERAMHFPGRAAIDAYGNGGFRFAGMSHRGSIICLPSGVYGWEPRVVRDITVEQLGMALAESAAMKLLLLGTGGAQVLASRELRRTFEEAGIALEAMATGAAARTYNVLLAEGRPVGTALLAVD